MRFITRQSNCTECWMYGGLCVRHTQVRSTNPDLYTNLKRKPAKKAPKK